MSEKLTAVAKTFTYKELPDSEVEFSGEIPAEVIAEYTKKALTYIAEGLELPGFRKGHVPSDIAIKKVGELTVLQEAVEFCVKDLYPTLVLEHNIEAVGRPDIRVTKLAPGNPVAITARTAVYPDVVLPKEWKVVGSKVPLEVAAEATDKEVDETLQQLRTSRASHSADATAGQEPLLPELDDTFAKSVGAFDSLLHLKEQIKKGIGEEKARVARRGKIIEALLEKTKVLVPSIFVESELDKIMGQMREDITRFGMTFEQYLENSKKTEEGVRNEFREQAKKRAMLQLTLNKIVGEEKVEADEAAVAEEMKHALEHFPEAKPELVRIHIETVLRNEKVLQMLEDTPKN